MRPGIREPRDPQAQRDQPGRRVLRAQQDLVADLPDQPGRLVRRELRAQQARPEQEVPGQPGRLVRRELRALQGPPDQRVRRVLQAPPE